MLFPEAVKARNWKNEIEFRINPARPGRYWLKAVWDRKPPFSYDLWSLDGFQTWLASTNNAIAFEPGDAESVAPEMFEIQAKQSAGAVLECRTIE